jgi:hypothetical protein
MAIAETSDPGVEGGRKQQRRDGTGTVVVEKERRVVLGMSAPSIIVGWNGELALGYVYASSTRRVMGYSRAGENWVWIGLIGLG